MTSAASMQWTLSLREGARRQPCRGPCAAFRAPQADRRRDRLNRRRHNRRSVGVVDSDERVSYGGDGGEWPFGHSPGRQS